MTRPETDFLDALFDEAKSQTAEPSDALMSRVLADAAHFQPQAAPVERQKQSLWARLFNDLGGWPALSGVAAAGVAGLWFGLAPPDAFDGWVGEVMGSTTSVSFGYDLAMFEEGAIDG